jgi:predicted alpha/beta-fold hydrolase
MNQLIPFHKPNNKVRSEKMMNYFITQAKHPINNKNHIHKDREPKLDKMAWVLDRDMRFTKPIFGFSFA